VTRSSLFRPGGGGAMAAVLRAFERLDGQGLTEPGEFSRRAFDSARLDLTAIERLGIRSMRRPERATGRYRAQRYAWRWRREAAQPLGNCGDVVAVTANSIAVPSVGSGK